MPGGPAGANAGGGQFPPFGGGFPPGLSGLGGPQQGMGPGSSQGPNVNSMASQAAAAAGLLGIAANAASQGGPGGPNLAAAAAALQQLQAAAAAAGLPSNAALLAMSGLPGFAQPNHNPQVSQAAQSQMLPPSQQVSAAAVKHEGDAKAQSGQNSEDHVCVRFGSPILILIYMLRREPAFIHSFMPPRALHCSASRGQPRRPKCDSVREAARRTRIRQLRLHVRILVRVLFVLFTRTQ